MCSIEFRLVLSLCLAGMKIKQVLGINANQICVKHGNKVGFKGSVSSCFFYFSVAATFTGQKLEFPVVMLRHFMLSPPFLSWIGLSVL